MLHEQPQNLIHILNIRQMNKKNEDKKPFSAILNCFKSWDNCFIGTGSLLNTLIPV
jgi:hypothetical protein